METPPDQITARQLNARYVDFASRVNPIVSLALNLRESLAIIGQYDATLAVSDKERLDAKSSLVKLMEAFGKDEVMAALEPSPPAPENAGDIDSKPTDRSG